MSAPNPTAVQDYFEAQRYLAHVLRPHGVDLFAGLTDTTSRMQAARATIQAHRLSAVVMPSHSGKPVTYAKYFSRTFGTSLEVSP